MCNTPQTTLVLPPEVKLIDKLADKAVHDCDISRGRTLRVRILTFNTAKANPNIDLGWSALQWSARVKHNFMRLTEWKSCAVVRAGGPWQSIERRRPSF